MAGEWTQVVTYHQELTADLPRLAVSLPLHSAPLLSPLSSDRWCESSRRQSRTTPLPHHRRERRREALNHFGTELRQSARPPNAAPRPVTAERRSRCPPEEIRRRGVSSRGHIWGQYRAVSFGLPASGGFWGQIAVGIQEQEKEEESRPFQRCSPGDASVNARAMSRRKQGNPQHLSQREITRKYTCKNSHHHSTGFAFSYNLRCHSEDFLPDDRCVKMNIFKLGSESLPKCLLKAIFLPLVYWQN